LIAKIAEGERRASARASALAKRREGSTGTLGTPETLRKSEAQEFESEISIDMQDSDTYLLSTLQLQESYKTNNCVKDLAMKFIALEKDNCHRSTTIFPSLKQNNTVG